MSDLISQINGIVWGPFMLGLLALTGLFLSFGLKGYTISNIGMGFRLLWKGRDGSGKGDISKLQCTDDFALSDRWHG